MNKSLSILLTVFLLVSIASADYKILYNICNGKCDVCPRNYLEGDKSGYSEITVPDSPATVTAGSATITYNSGNKSISVIKSLSDDIVVNNFNVPIKNDGLNSQKYDDTDCLYVTYSSFNDGTCGVTMFCNSAYKTFISKFLLVAVVATTLLTFLF